MKRILSIFIAIFIVSRFALAANTVSVDRAQQLANNFMAGMSAKTNIELLQVSMCENNNNIYAYIFDYGDNGFVITSTNDAITPILAYSTDNKFELIPPVQLWLEIISNEIEDLLQRDYSEPINTRMWEDANMLIEANSPAVNPLCTTTWDQDTWYNFYCPVAAGGPGGKAYAGCVATSMGQIMKYHSFPEKGVLSHTYVHSEFGAQTVNFANSTYEWNNMGNTANSSSYTQIAKLLRDAGVAVNMNYSANGSGAYSSDVPWAMSQYFNYNPLTIKYVEKDSYTNPQWISMLKTELDNSRPMYYSGVTQNNEGHAWLCDGYNTNDMFHMNWGWSGFSNGYFNVTASMSSVGGTFSKNFAAVIGIQPYNADLIVRLHNTRYDQLKSKHSTISWSMEKGEATSISLLVDDNVVFTGSGTDTEFKLNDPNLSYDYHNIKVRAINGNDTVYHLADVIISDWEQIPSGFTQPSRGINYISAVDTNVIWGIGYNGIDPSKTINEFIRSIDGGRTWSSGEILGGNTYGIGNICGVNEDIAYATVYNGVGAQDNNCGVYKTTDGGATWTKKGTALQGAASFANNVHFWDENVGMCHGDVKDGYFEIYTTTNGGNTWTRVPKSNIGQGANPLSGEGAWTTVIEAVDENTVMFGSNKSNLFISDDRGLTWRISSTGIAANPQGGGINTIAFKDKMNGIAGQTIGTPKLKSTNDGGATWTDLALTGAFMTAGLDFVEGTENTYVCTGSAQGKTGAAVSFDGGNTWEKFAKTEAYQFLDVDAKSPSHIWAGGFCTIELLDGIFSYQGVLIPEATFEPIINLTATVDESTVTLNWTAPQGQVPTSYKVYRDQQFLASTGDVTYIDNDVPNGQHNYCVVAVYPEGESDEVCIVSWVTTNIDTEEAAYRIYPNPTSNILNIVSPRVFNEVRMYNNSGKLVYNDYGRYSNKVIDVNNLSAGVYFIKLIFDDNVISKKVIVR
ncbi:MAG: C10 family peptidase [Bacteroidales bacterium]